VNNIITVSVTHFSYFAIMQGTTGLDSDNDGLTDYHEHYNYGTDPQLWDTDGDGYSDGDEISNGTDPLDPTSYPHTHSTTRPIPGFELLWIFVVFTILIIHTKRKSIRSFYPKKNNG
ncbi:MAG: hypothetical protein ACTSRP_22075, partial [Candidatus Helarchaeota archaeon]